MNGMLLFKYLYIWNEIEKDWCLFYQHWNKDRGGVLGLVAKETLNTYYLIIYFNF